MNRSPAAGGPEWLAAARLDPLTRADIADVTALRQRIWREHHRRFITPEQVEYMLASRYGERDLEPFIGAQDRWFDVLRVQGWLCGFLRCLHGQPDTLTLSEIYLDASVRRTGLGQLLLERARSLARERDCRTIVLHVNRHNDAAVTAYRRAGFVVVAELRIDIGGGFFMDDFRMELTLAPTGR